jgi:hypothetical protein
VVIKLAKSIVEEKIKGISNISSMANYVKFASNYEMAEKLFKQNKMSEAKKHYEAALNNLKGIKDPDSLVIDNIKMLKNQLNKLDI